MNTSPPARTGALALLEGLAGAGVEVCFANPGTSEMHLVAGLEASPLRPVLVLFEGVASGAADGYGRMAGKPAASLFHLGPGFANGIANFHNARRAATPIVALIGDHPDSHIPFDAPLTSDINSLARPVSGWLARLPSAGDAESMAVRAVMESLRPPGQIATLVIPADCAWNEAPPAAKPAFSQPTAPPPDDEAIDRAAKTLKQAVKPVLMMRGKMLLAEGLKQAGRIAAAVPNLRLMSDCFPPRLQRGAGRVMVERLPYFPEQVEESLAGVDCLVLAGAAAPVSFFAYQGKESSLVPSGCEVVRLATPQEDGIVALTMLAEALGASKNPALAEKEVPELPTGELTPLALGQVLAALMPEGAVFCDESATSGGPAFGLTATSVPHDYLPLTGGAIGQALPLATGAAIAAQGRKVVCLSGDGGAMYTIQSLWTQAREKLNIVNVICSNRSYAILRMELMRAGVANPGPKALSLFDLDNPALGWVELAQGMGVEASRAETAEDFAAQLQSALTKKTPCLIEAVL